MVRCIGHSWHLYSWRCWCIHFCPPFFGCQRFFDSWRRHLDQPGLKQVPSLFTSWTWRGKTGTNKRKNRWRCSRRCGLQVVRSRFFRDYLLVFLCLLTAGVFFFHDGVKSKGWVLLFLSPSLLVERRPILKEKVKSHSMTSTLWALDSNSRNLPKLRGYIYIYIYISKTRTDRWSVERQHPLVNFWVSSLNEP